MDWNQRADFFRFTQGRFVCTEAKQMVQRYVKFNMNELCRVAGDSVGKKCVNVEKYPDGMYNKAFLLTMDDDQHLVAKVPNPNAGLPKLTTASEVATMDFVSIRPPMSARSNSDIDAKCPDTPAPRVITWSSNSETTVEAEYIIMEKAKGVQLALLWPTLDIGQRAQVVRSIARYQLAWTKATFGKTGSLYYASDLNPTGDNLQFNSGPDATSTHADSRFAVGRILGRDWLDHGRTALEVDRGPWPSTITFKRAEIERDLRAVHSLRSLPKPLSMLCGPGLYQPNRGEKLRAGAAALQVLPRVLPDEAWSSTFHIWHDDLHLENIFVLEDRPTEITAIIDWQSTAIAPLFDHAMFPGYLEYEGPPVNGIERPTAPQLMETATDAERTTAWTLYEEQALASGYKRLLRKAIQPAFEALMWQESDESDVVNAARSILDNSEAYCLGAIAALQDSPVNFTEGELAQIQRGVESTQKSVHTMDRIKRTMEDLFPEKGLVRHDEYEEAKSALRQIKMRVVEEFSSSQEDRSAWEEAWPFDE